MKTDPSNEVSIDGVDLDLTILIEKFSNETFNKDFDNLFKSDSTISSVSDEIPEETSDFERTITSSDKIPKDRNDLEKMKLVVRSFQGNANAGVSIPGFGGIKLGKKEASVSSYYIETKIVHSKEGRVVYGCGYSLHYLFKKVKRGLGLDNIPSICASVQLENNKTEVYYSLQTYGIIGQSLMKFFKPTVNMKFDVEGFGVMQSSVDGIQNILGDPILSKSVRFNPEKLNFLSPDDLEQI